MSQTPDHKPTHTSATFATTHSSSDASPGDVPPSTKAPFFQPKQTVNYTTADQGAPADDA